MIGVVIGDQECLAQDGLAVAVRDPGVQIRLRVPDQGHHRLQITAKRRHALRPRAAGRGGIRVGLRAEFKREGGGGKLMVEGFWDRGRRWVVRTALPQPGVWLWRTESADGGE